MKILYFPIRVRAGSEAVNHPGHRLPNNTPGATRKIIYQASSRLRAEGLNNRVKTKYT